MRARSIRTIAPRRWTEHDIGDQAGKVAVITGANSGLGFEVARQLAVHGATVVLACRDDDRATAAADRLLAEAGPTAPIETVRLDLADLAVVREAAASLRARHPRIDVLVNNAGV